MFYAAGDGSGEMAAGGPGGMGMTPAQRAFLDAQVALSAWRAAKDAEAQVAHWLVEGRATREELVRYRARTREAHQEHRRAQRAYARACEAMPRQASGMTGMTGMATRVR